MSVGVLAAGFILDMLLGDALGMIHPVRGIGFIIKAYERLFFKDGKYPRIKGAGLCIIVIALTAGLSAGIIYVSYHIHPAVGSIIEILLAWSLLCAKDLKKESMRVYEALCEENIEKARYSLSMIVGRDTINLNEEEIIKATVETIAENTSDGEIAPLIYMAIGGPVLGYIYKAINTMDSMVGYKNEKYMHYGTPAARLDDVVNLVPSRLAGFVACIVSYPLGYDAKGAFRSFRKYRNKTESPNAGQTESAFAGALGISLGKDASYFGKTVHKPILGEPSKKIERDDIVRANRLMYGISFSCVILSIALRFVINMIIRKMI